MQGPWCTEKNTKEKTLPFSMTIMSPFCNFLANETHIIMIYMCSTLRGIIGNGLSTVRFYITWGLSFVIHQKKYHQFYHLTINNCMKVMFCKCDCINCLFPYIIALDLWLQTVLYWKHYHQRQLMYRWTK